MENIAVQSERFHQNNSLVRVCLVILWEKVTMSLVLKCIGFYFTVYCLPLPLLLTHAVSPSHLKHSRTDRMLQMTSARLPSKTRRTLTAPNKTQITNEAMEIELSMNTIRKDNKHCKCNFATDGENMYYCE